jgi:hypothetical protein
MSADAVDMPTGLAQLTVAERVVMLADRAECALTAVAHNEARRQRHAADSAVEHAAALVAAADSMAAAAAHAVAAVVDAGNIGALRM